MIDAGYCYFCQHTLFPVEGSAPPVICFSGNANKKSGWFPSGFLLFNL